MRKIITGIVAVLLTASCSHYQDWRNNNPERDKLLNHYPAGSLKRKAAEFLVKNMTYHTSHDNNDLEGFRNIVLAQPDTLPSYVTPEILDSLWMEAIPFVGQVEVRKDIEYITADFLIAGIDEAFDNWEKSPWKDSLSFEMLLHTILPYNVANEPLIPRRALLRGRRTP